MCSYYPNESLGGDAVQQKEFFLKKKKKNIMKLNKKKERKRRSSPLIRTFPSLVLANQWKPGGSDEVLGVKGSKARRP